MVAADDHVGDIERSGRTVKECTRCHVYRNPYERYAKLMITGCVVQTIKGLNQIPALNGIPDDVIPDTTITGKSTLNFNEITKLNFEDYVQAYRMKRATNTNKARYIGAISLYQLGNEQGRWMFMPLSSENRTHCYKWEVLPVDEDVINRVHELALKEGQPKIDTHFKYEWTADNEMFDEGDNEEETEDIDGLLHQNTATQPTILNMDEDDVCESVEHEDEEINSEDRKLFTEDEECVLFPEDEMEEDVGVVVPEDEVYSW